MKFVIRKFAVLPEGLSRKRATLLLSFVNKRLDCVKTGIVCFAVYSRGGDACVFGDSTKRRGCYAFFLVTRELQVILDTREAVFEIERRLRVGVFLAKTSTCFWSFAVRIGNELQEIPGYLTTAKR